MNCQSASDCPDPPIGSAPAVANCSPCQAVDPANIAATLESLQRRLCDAEAKMLNWGGRLDSARNRLTAAEGALTLLRKPTAPVKAAQVNVCGMDEVTEADAIAVCNDGSGGLLALEECQAPVMRDGKIVGQEIGATILDAPNTLVSGVYTSNQSVDVPDAGCRKWAICQVRMTGTTTSTASMTLKAQFPGGNKEEVAMLYISDESGSYSSTILLPIVDGKIKFDVVTTTHLSASNRAFWIKLVGLA